ncbi:hypothetical protein CRG98_030729, partial [Punica granatum]
AEEVEVEVEVEVAVADDQRSLGMKAQAGSALTPPTEPDNGTKSSCSGDESNSRVYWETKMGHMGLK